MSEFDDFLAKQEGIFQNSFREPTTRINETGIEPDEAGTAPQAAFLVSLRYPHTLTSLVTEFSAEVADTIKTDDSPHGALRYDASNAHTTISDYGLERDLVIDIDQIPGQHETYFNIHRAVGRALDETHRVLKDQAVEFGAAFTNGKTAIITGVPNEDAWLVRQAILAESEDTPTALKGTWGTHMTVSRFLVEHAAGTEQVDRLKKLLDRTPAFGVFKPEFVSVGYFNTNPDTGFALSSPTRFEL